MRADLLFRVKGQTVRIDPVTTTNVEDVIDRFIRHSSSAAKWEPRLGQPDPRQRLIEKITALIEAVDTTDKGPYRPVFGHKREIRNAIDLIEVFAATARTRGSRPSSGEFITAEHVEAMFRPSGILLPADVAGGGAGVGSDPADKAAIEFETELRKGISTALTACGLRQFSALPLRAGN